MARVPIDKTVRLRGGATVAGIELYVYERGTTTEVPVYDAESGGSVVAQPLTSDAEGRFPNRWVAPGSYDLYSPDDAENPTVPWEALSGNDTAHLSEDEVASGLWRFTQPPEVKGADGSRPIYSPAAEEALWEIELDGGDASSIFHLTSADTTHANSRLFGLGPRAGNGIVINNRETATGLEIVQFGASGPGPAADAISSPFAYGAHLHQYSDEAPVTFFEQKVYGAKEMAVFFANEDAAGGVLTGSKLTRWAAYKLATGEFTDYGYVASDTGALTWLVRALFQGGADFSGDDALDDVIRAYVEGDAKARATIRADGTIALGNGTDNADLELARDAAGKRLKTSQQIQAEDGLATKVKTGTLADGDFGVAPPNGTIAINGAAKAIEARIGGAWKSQPIGDYDRDFGLPGLLALPYPFTGTSTASAAANQARLVRIVPSRDITVASISFIVTVAAGADDNVDVGIYDASYNRIVSSGPVAGKLNSTGVKNIDIPDTTLIAGTVYYVGLAPGAAGGSSPTLVTGAVTSANVCDIFGNGPGTRIAGVQVGAHPLPATANPSGGTNPFVLALIEA